jgi:hypothetical protein
MFGAKFSYDGLFLWKLTKVQIALHVGVKYKLYRADIMLNCRTNT